LDRKVQKATGALDEQFTRQNPFTPPVPSAPSTLPSTAPEPAGIQTTKNISSDEIEKKEVTEIANELKQGLQSTPKSEEIKPEKPAEDHLNDDDTIVIDQEGNLHQAHEDQKPSS
jgi:hypothetical protein